MKILLGLLLGIGFSVSAQTGQLNGVKTVDQWGKTAEINQETKIVLFSHDMNGSDVVKAVFKSLDVKDLPANHWLYIADISGMPSLISKLFAIPEMKKYPYAVALDKTGDVTKDWQRKENSVTVLMLKNAEVQSIKYFSDEKVLGDFLNKNK